MFYLPWHMPLATAPFRQIPSTPSPGWANHNRLLNMGTGFAVTKQSSALWQGHLRPEAFCSEPIVIKKQKLNEMFQTTHLQIGLVV